MDLWNYKRAHVLGIGGIVLEVEPPKRLKGGSTLAVKGEIVLFSPAFASFGKWFRNEYDRYEQFNALLAKLE